jgi:hypothetical protein
MQSDAPACELGVQVPAADCDGMADEYDVTGRIAPKCVLREGIYYAEFHRQTAD